MKTKFAAASPACNASRSTCSAAPAAIAPWSTARLTCSSRRSAATVEDSGPGFHAGPGAPIVNNVEMRDTGVILKVIPRVNANGVVNLDVSQEVWDDSQRLTALTTNS